MTILDRVADSSAHFEPGFFRPQTTDELFALRLATKLNDSPAVRHYAELVDSHSRSQLLIAYGRTVRSGDSDLGRRFHRELNRLNDRNGHHVESKRLVAIRVERRAVAVAIMTGEFLEYAQAKQMSSSTDKAIGSAVGFVAKLLGKFERLTSAALEQVPSEGEAQRGAIQDAVQRVLRERAMDICEIGRHELLAGFGSPAICSRAELRQVVSRIYDPQLEEEPGLPWIQDAAALGLFVQMERLFVLEN
jgi:hypothetical protein